MANYTFKPHQKDKAPIKFISGDKGRARIWNVFKPSIILDELSLPETHSGKGNTQKIEDLISLQHPLIKINDYYVGENEIDSFSIDSIGKFPTITLSLSFVNELFLSKNMPKDGDIISIMIQSKSEILKPDRKSTRLNSSHTDISRMPSSA